MIDFKAVLIPVENYDSSSQVFQVTVVFWDKREPPRENDAPPVGSVNTLSGLKTQFPRGEWQEDYRVSIDFLTGEYTRHLN